MKKTAVITLNLKKRRSLFLFPLFVLVTLVTATLSSNVVPIKLSSIVSEALVKNSFSLFTANTTVLSVFPIAVIPPEKEKAIAKKASAEPISKPMSEAKILPAVKTPDTNSGIVTNNTSIKIDSEKLMPLLPDLKNASVLIVHTHTTESYTPTEKYSYTPTDTDRTTDENYNVIRIGEVIRTILEKNGIKVYHDKTLNDYPSYNGSYARSLAVCEKYLKKDSSIKIILDVHRDAVIGKDGKCIKYLSDISGKKAASLMFVIGSDESGLKHSEWEKNMAFALKLQSHTESLYPGLMRPVNLRKQRFNQHLTPGSLIVEVGTNANTLEEAITGAEFFADALSSFLKA